jgi:hypothetical protein
VWRIARAIIRATCDLHDYENPAVWNQVRNPISETERRRHDASEAVIGLLALVLGFGLQLGAALVSVA